jgi:hypothetical protein
MFYNHIADKAPAFELPRFRNSENVDAEHRALEIRNGPKLAPRFAGKRDGRLFYSRKAGVKTVRID